DAAGVLEARAALRPKGGHRARDLAAHPAACVRDAPAQPRCGPSRRAVAARPRRHLDHADLHARRPRAVEAAASPAPSARMIGTSKGAATPATAFLAEHRVEFTEHFYEYVEHGGTRVSSGALNVSEHEVVKTLVME